MAIYEYECPKCGAVETLQRPMSMSNSPGPFCIGPLIENAHKRTRMTKVVSRFSAVVRNGTRN